MTVALKNVVRPVYWFARNWRFHPARAEAYWWNWRAERQHTLLNESQFRASRRSDTLFVFGSGYSLNSITPPEWSHMAQHDTMGFNYFIKQNFIRADYHIFRELSMIPLDRAAWEPEYREYFDVLNQNPLFNDTILMMQKGWLSLASNRAIGLNLLDKPRRLLRFSNSNMLERPSRHLKDGIAHHLGTLSDALHLGYIGGWKEIVVVGVDLYDRRYFWLGENELRPDEYAGATVDSVHNTALNGIVTFVGSWGAYFAQQGIRLSIYNPRSLLTQVLPVYEYAVQA